MTATGRTTRRATIPRDDPRLGEARGEHEQLPGDEGPAAPAPALEEGPRRHDEERADAEEHERQHDRDGAARGASAEDLDEHPHGQRDQRADLHEDQEEGQDEGQRRSRGAVGGHRPSVRGGPV
ncbi:hypothetical protein [Georgenia sp. Marseille-Q6866]